MFCMSIHTYAFTLSGIWYTYTFIWTNLHVYCKQHLHDPETFMHTCLRKHTCMHTYIHTHTYTQHLHVSELSMGTCLCIHTYIHTYICTHMHTSRLCMIQKMCLDLVTWFSILALCSWTWPREVAFSHYVDGLCMVCPHWATWGLVKTQAILCKCSVNVV
jgi:hypothetical protein